MKIVIDMNLDRARQLVRETGYGRREREVAYLEKPLERWLVAAGKHLFEPVPGAGAGLNTCLRPFSPPATGLNICLRPFSPPERP